jgi:hypothetical protein
VILCHILLAALLAALIFNDKYYRVLMLVPSVRSSVQKPNVKKKKEEDVLFSWEAQIATECCLAGFFNLRISAIHCVVSG